MTPRIEEELALLRRRYGDLEYQEQGQWVKLPSYPVAHPGANRKETPIVFQIPQGYPGAQPYGFYVPAGLLLGVARPGSYTEPAQNAPPFGGAWGFFSWSPDDGQWRPAATVAGGANLLNWAFGFSARFLQGA
jgi:hypothetical protein